MKSRHGFWFVEQISNTLQLFLSSSGALKISEHHSGPLLETVNKTLLAFLELLPRRLRRTLGIGTKD